MIKKTMAKNKVLQYRVNPEQLAKLMADAAGQGMMISGDAGDFTKRGATVRYGYNRHSETISLEVISCLPFTRGKAEGTLEDLFDGLGFPRA